MGFNDSICIKWFELKLHISEFEGSLGHWHMIDLMFVFVIYEVQYMSVRACMCVCIPGPYARAFLGLSLGLSGAPGFSLPLGNWDR